MSRGFGRVERDVLEVFGNNVERVIDSIEITALIVGRNNVTESEISSCRRALRSLARQGKIVDLGRNGFRFGRRRYALPDTAAEYQRTGPFGGPPRPAPPILKAGDVEAAILKIVLGGFSWGEDRMASFYTKPEAPPQPGEVPYGWLLNRVLERFSSVREANVRSAVSKAVRRLISQGMIEARGIHLGRNQHQTCLYVRLIEA